MCLVCELPGGPTHMAEPCCGLVRDEVSMVFDAVTVTALTDARHMCLAHVTRHATSVAGQQRCCATTVLCHSLVCGPNQYMTPIPAAAPICCPTGRQQLLHSHHLHTTAGRQDNRP